MWQVRVLLDQHSTCEQFLGDTQSIMSTGTGIGGVANEDRGEELTSPLKK